MAGKIALMVLTVLSALTVITASPMDHWEGLIVFAAGSAAGYLSVAMAGDLGRGSAGTVRSGNVRPRWSRYTIQN